MLYIYRDGTYKGDGKQWVRRRLTEVLGEEWRRNRSDEVVNWLTHSAEEMWSSPPLNRVCCANGILNLDTGELEPHSPDFRSPVQIAAAYDPDARCPAIDAFVRDVFPADSTDLAWEIAGYLTVPDNSMQKAVMLLGPGSNGKSTYLSLLQAFIGPQNVSTVSLHEFEADRFAAVDIYGKLANVFADLDPKALSSSSIFKSITGGDTLRGQHKFADPFTFKPYARLLFSANEAPPTSDSSDAFFRRWLIVPFAQTFAPGSRDPRLLNKLTTPAELSGLLNHAIPALRELRARGTFTSTEATDAAHERFRVDVDSVAGFCNEFVRTRPDAQTPRPDLFRRYCEWCKANNRIARSAAPFNADLRQRFGHAIEEKTIRGTRYWQGLDVAGVSADDE